MNSPMQAEAPDDLVQPAEGLDASASSTIDAWCAKRTVRELMLHEGMLFERNLHSECVEIRDILAAARLAHGIVHLKAIRSVVLESNGSLSIKPYSTRGHSGA